MTSRTTAPTTDAASRPLFRVARKLADTAVPKLADATSVDVLDLLLHGAAPPPGPVDATVPLRRAAFLSRRGAAARGAYAVGEVSLIPPATPYRHALSDLRPRLIHDLYRDAGWLARDPRRARLLRAAGAHSALVLPLTVGGVVLGLFVLYRRTGSTPFDEADLREAGRLADDAALCLDRERRRTEEDALVRLLRRSLPDGFPAVSALEAVHGQVPAGAPDGQWCDVLPLAGARVALVVGAAEGSGVRAAASMNRLRAAITTLAALDLPPDELLAHLDDVVTRLSRQHPAPGPAPDDPDRTGASCLYVIYDPATELCVSARAGGPTVLVAHPDGGVSAPGLAAHAPLGTDEGPYGPCEPYENTEFSAPSGSLLLLSCGGTEGLCPAGDSAVDGLGPGPDTSRPLRHLLRDLPPDGDRTLLLTRTRALNTDHVATLTLPPDPAAVADARAWAGARLAAWTLDDLADSTTLVVSELVTNALRYATGPIGIRLIRDDRVLICEVSDSSGSGPHRRRPKATDEGGRGLSIVTRLTQHQGTRYTASGKIVWTEQSLPARADVERR
ncbi:SpoIIE family protein phosphatase [Streptomyces sp. NPDC058001]|uniref:SpoIIE family protein phosphatase n=1 Tax=Streptomyces sp. NPDC058001 TaxID=3346300 RepID=UPI0036E9E459